MSTVVFTEGIVPYTLENNKACWEWARFLHLLNRDVGGQAEPLDARTPPSRLHKCCIRSRGARTACPRGRILVTQDLRRSQAAQLHRHSNERSRSATPKGSKILAGG